ncbi:MAG: protease SohB [Deltaproteobacteria bacterium]|nr:protease SohB [Deltaproteobacteria bacterium]
MIEFFAEYGLFLLKTITIVGAIVIVLVTAAAAGKKASHHEGLEVESLNKKYQTLASELKRAVMKKADWKREAKAEKQRSKAAAKSDELRRRGFVIDFKGDLLASAVPSLREEVSAVLAVATSDDQVIVRLENHGGVVHEHGLAASQLVRIREQGIPLIVAVDKVAASGGYLMACVANSIAAAPFAILGSIGVIAQIPNFARLMDSHGIDFEQVTAGRHKRNVTMFGVNTDEDRAKLKEELEDVHRLFAGAVSRYRPDLDLDKVTTGEHWYGIHALELGLADEIRTSDELLADLARDFDLYRVSYKFKHPLQKRLAGHIEGVLEKADSASWRRRFESRLPR